jgi:hypothetical protein
MKRELADKVLGRQWRSAAAAGMGGAP